MHVAVFYQHYHNPDYPSTGRLYSFLRHWAARHEVTLITTRVRFEQRRTRKYPWVPPGVRVVMLDVPYDNAMGVGQRLMSYLYFAAGALWEGLRIPGPDAIVGISTPLTTAWAAETVARLRGVPWVFVVQDLWPEFPIQMGALPSPWLQRRLYRLEKRLYQRAAHIIPFSPDMADHIVGLGVPPEKITMQYNGTDFWLIDACTSEAVEALRQEYGLAGKRVVLYAGTLGRANDIPTLIGAAERLAHRNDVYFVVTGSGYHEKDVREAAKRLPNVLLIPAQPRFNVFAWFSLADVSLVPFLDLPVLATNSPAKFYDSLGCGTPVIVTNPGWTKRFVEEHGCGWYVPASDPQALAECLNRLLDEPKLLVEAGRRGEAIAREYFDRTALAAEMEAILEDVVAQSRRK